MTGTAMSLLLPRTSGSLDEVHRDTRDDCFQPNSAASSDAGGSPDQSANRRAAGCVAPSQSALGYEIEPPALRR